MSCAVWWRGVAEGSNTGAARMALLLLLAPAALLYSMALRIRALLYQSGILATLNQAASAASRARRVSAAHFRHPRRHGSGSRIGNGQRGTVVCRAPLSATDQAAVDPGTGRDH